MRRKVMVMFITGLMISTVMMIGGCDGEEKTEPQPVTTPEPVPVTAPEPESEPEPTPSPALEPEPTPEPKPTPKPEPAKVSPVAKISAVPDTGIIGQSITLSGADSFDSDGTITSYEWEFGDGHTASGVTVANTYSDRCGTYNIRLSVRDNDDLSDSAVTSINIVMGISIRIEATASTWRAGKEPYDIYGAIRQKLEEAGFEVVSPESEAYNAKLLVEYKEECGSLYEPLEGGGPTSRGTDITCNLKLYDEAQHLILEKDIYGTTRGIATDLYESALKAFTENLYFKYMGEFIASEFGVRDDISVMIDTLQDNFSTMRGQAVEILVEIGEPAVEPLIVLINHESGRVRQYAAEALGKIGDVRAVQPLIGALNDKEVSVRSEIAEALGNIGDTTAVEPLIQTLKDEDYQVRAKAAEALGNIGDARAIETLSQALEDKSSMVREAAEAALEKIGLE